jgi:hypothetical protein
MWENINIFKLCLINFFIMKHIYIFIALLGAMILGPVNAQDYETGNITDFAGKARAEAVAFAIGTYGYVGLGTNGTEHFADFWQYNPADDSWKEIKPFPGASRKGAVAFVVGDYAYVGTGIGDGGARYNDFFRYDPENNEWQSIAAFGGGNICYAVAFAAGGAGYVGTGIGHNGEDSNDFWKYDPAKNEWTQIASAPGKRRNASGVSLNGKGYLMAGVAYNPTTNVYSDIREYDPATDKWKEILYADMNFSFNSAAGFVIFDKFYMAYGNKDFIAGYDVLTDKVTKVGDVFTFRKSRYDPVSFVIDGVVYFGAGYEMITWNTSTYHTEFWTFVPKVAEASVYNFTGGGSYCEGGTSSVSATLQNSEKTMMYQLFRDGEVYDIARKGTDSGLSWTQLPKGTFTVKAWNGKEYKDMNGTVEVEELAVIEPAVVISAAKTELPNKQDVEITASANSDVSFIYTWYVNNSQKWSDTSPKYSFTPENGDKVYCEVSSTYKCLSAPFTKSNELTFVVGSSGTWGMNLQVEVYPNPVTSNLRVNVPGFAGEVEVNVYSLQGSLVMTQTQMSDAFSVDVSHLTKGSYILKVQNHIKVVSLVFVKE